MGESEACFDRGEYRAVALYAEWDIGVLSGFQINGDGEDVCVESFGVAVNRDEHGHGGGDVALAREGGEAFAADGAEFVVVKVFFRGEGEDRVSKGSAVGVTMWSELHGKRGKGRGGVTGEGYVGDAAKVVEFVIDGVGTVCS